jgi:Mrp family chromosome partitioning ATPase
MQSLSDAAVLSTLVDGTLVVVSAGHSRRRNLQLTMETLRRAGANVLGIVLNRVSAKAELGYPGYYPANADDMPGDPAAAGATTSTPGATS